LSGEKPAPQTGVTKNSFPLVEFAQLVGKFGKVFVVARRVLIYGAVTSYENCGDYEAARRTTSPIG
jgi:hypothetical protein